MFENVLQRRDGRGGGRHGYCGYNWTEVNAGAVMSQAPTVPALPQRSRKGAAIMPISDTLGWVGGRCRSVNGCNTDIRDHVELPASDRPPEFVANCFMDRGHAVFGQGPNLTASTTLSDFTHRSCCQENPFQFEHSFLIDPLATIPILLIRAMQHHVPFSAWSLVSRSNI